MHCCSTKSYNYIHNTSALHGVCCDRVIVTGTGSTASFTSLRMCGQTFGTNGLLNFDCYIKLQKKHFAKSAKTSHVGMHFHQKTLPQKAMKQVTMHIAMHAQTTHTSQRNAFALILQRLSVVVQRGNSASVLGTTKFSTVLIVFVLLKCD